MMKKIKFRRELAGLILNGQKSSTWRLFDDKDIQVGDNLKLVIWENGEVFATAAVIKVTEKPLGELSKEDKAGHESFNSDAEMYETYKKYYGPSVGPDTIAKLIWFELQ